MKMRISELRQVIREILEDDVEEQIEELQSDAALKNIDSFVESKLENDEYEYNFVELQALARNEMHKSVGGKKLHIASPSQSVVEKIKRELGEIGFKFVGRESVKKVRGVTSPSHGSNPFAGMSGGSGLGSNAGGPVGIGIGGGPGAIGGKYEWDSGDKRNLAMGSRRR